MEGPALRLQLANDRSALEPARLAVLAFLAPFSPSARAVYAIELVLEEVLTNEIKYAFDDRAEHSIELTVGLEPEAVVLHFEDGGVAFDPLQASAPPAPTTLDDAPVGGLGLVLVRSFATSATYERRDGRNCLTIAVALA
jgi:anti-sigma regulatory factor (Ser/Thr protein kinase)